MKANSNTRPDSVVRMSENNYQIRWNVASVQRSSGINSEGIVDCWDYEYSSKYNAEAITQKELMLAVIRENYDIDDEINIAMRRPEDVDALAVHEAWIQFAKETAISIIAEYEAI